LEVQERLRQSELLHRTLSANLPDTSVFLFDRDLRILIAEGEGVRRLPWIDEEMFRGRTVHELQGELPSEILALSLECYQGALAGERRGFEFTSAGLTFEVTAVPIRDRDGEVESAMAVVRDVTERRAVEADRARLAAIVADSAMVRAERSARESQERLQALLDHAPTPMRLRDMEGRYLVINRSCAELIGSTVEDALSRDPLAPYPSRIANYLDEQERRVRAGEGTSTIEVSADDIDGRRHEYLATKFPVTDGDGQTVAVGGIWFDVTERKQAEQAMRAAEERYRDMFESAPTGIIETTLEGVPLGVNQAWASLFGYDSPEQFLANVANTSELYVDPSDREAMAREVQDHDAVKGFELRMRRRDATTVWVAIDGRSITRAEGGVARWQASAVDITERKRFALELQEANVKLERANLAKDHFLATMSHELRTPLNAILGFTGTLLMGLHGTLTDEQTKPLQTVQRSSKHLLSLINDLLDLAQIGSEEMELHPEALDCQALLDEVAVGLQPLADEKGLLLEVVPASQPIELFCDRRAVAQILINLANNAIKFTDHGSVRLELSQRVGRHRSLTRFAVIDTGRGIAPEDQTRLFTAFEQIAGAGARAVEGTGLGLHISQTLAGLIDGSVTVESAPGEGSTFALEVRNRLAEVSDLQRFLEG
jgi:PAS domain S-box-containing protein